jgi:mutator protein MutT
MKTPLTLCMVCDGSRVLLGMKKRGFGAGQWNGFGGKIEPGESIEQAAVRELEEEAGISPVEMHKIGILEFTFENNLDTLEVHVFKVSAFTGEPSETEEMRPQWFEISDIPYDHMWSDDKYWLPYLLAGKTFRGKFLFDKPSTKEYRAMILTQELTEVENL